MGKIIRRTFVVGDLVTIAPDFRNNILDFDFEKYIGIILNVYEENEYSVYWTNAPVASSYKGMWCGDHLIKVENYESESDKVKQKHLHIIEL
jgi:hypothetical protein